MDWIFMAAATLGILMILKRLIDYLRGGYWRSGNGDSDDFSPWMDISEDSSHHDGHSDSGGCDSGGDCGGDGGGGGD